MSIEVKKIAERKTHHSYKKLVEAYNNRLKENIARNNRLKANIAGSMKYIAKKIVSGSPLRYEDPHGNSCSLGTTGFTNGLNTVYLDKKGDKTIVYDVHKQSFREDYQPISSHKAIKKVIPEFRKHLKYREEYKNNPEKENQKNYRNSALETEYRNFVEKTHNFVDKKDGTSSYMMTSNFGEDALHLLQESGISLPDGRDVVDVMTHVAGKTNNIKGTSIRISKGSKRDGKVYEIRPNEKIFQRQSGIDHSKFLDDPKLWRSKRRGPEKWDGKKSLSWCYHKNEEGKCFADFYPELVNLMKEKKSSNATLSACESALRCIVSAFDDIKNNQPTLSVEYHIELAETCLITLENEGEIFQKYVKDKKEELQQLKETSTKIIGNKTRKDGGIYR